ncbi:MAG: phosphatidylserine decarboxylase [Pseudomonadota bacterium]
MARKRFSIIATEGVPWLLAAALAAVCAYLFFDWRVALPFVAVTAVLVLLFQDPERTLPVEPSAVLAPCDGIVHAIELTTEGVLNREARRIVIRVNPFGAYTARCPVEGKLLDPRDNAAAGSKLSGANGLWVRTDANDDVVTLFRGLPVIGTPRAFVRYGERTGQGQRCAYLRLARRAHLLLPADIQVQVDVGDRVLAGSTIIARFRYR